MSSNSAITFGANFASLVLSTKHRSILLPSNYLKQGRDMQADGATFQNNPGKANIESRSIERSMTRRYIVACCLADIKYYLSQLGIYV